MSLRAKIFMTAMNVSFLFVSFLQPDDSIFLVTVYTIISSISWVFTLNEEIEIPEVGLCAYIGLAGFVCTCCIILSVSGGIETVTKQNVEYYAYVFSNDIAICAGKHFHYLWLSIVIIIIPMLLMIFEVGGYALTVEKAKIEKKENKKIMVLKIKDNGGKKYEFRCCNGCSKHNTFNHNTCCGRNLSEKC